MRKLLLSALTAAALALLPHSAAKAGKEEVVLGLSQDRVAITATFDGSEILVFGAVKRETPIPQDDPLEVVVAVSGPAPSVMVRRKEKKLGIWVNVDSVLVDSAPAFYAVATSAPFDQVLTDTEDLRYRISIKRAIRSVGAAMHIRGAQAFADAVVRIREKNGLYSLRENTVAVDEQTLFRTAIEMPADLTEGSYLTRIFLTRGGEVVSSYETTIDVRKVGLERFLYSLSREQPFLYGLMSLAIAVAAGWGASAAFSLLRNR
ncbi:TIGR02186 family protein [Leisingera caerulea]|uniref:TIGR02186 family protein n=1 Tax=Leisingera caerulea TaxID=506591 RepID=A0ABY5WYK2_LEICA|nr:TIGR02186 family protein [Leisingera caerulea]UWQ50547.1 TIGR02186 family protein [Leisingera caerulea]UWQ59231.1 TIGR02186 family protein [Leisingera caerulea]UWQ84277.1 TIGR02186 family protein [Leisingera caerulea]